MVDTIVFGLIAGLVFGIAAMLVMIPIKFSDNRVKFDAFAATFIGRFMLGLLIPTVSWTIPSVLTGLILGTMLSLPVAITVRAYTPIMTIGIVGGTVIGALCSLVC